MKSVYSIFFFLMLLSLTGCSDLEGDIHVEPKPVVEDTLLRNPVNPLSMNRKWTQTSIPTNLSNGTLQGAAYYNGQIYQFRHYTTSKGNLVSYDIYSQTDGKWTQGKTLSCVPQSYAGSAYFAGEVVDTYVLDDVTYHCTLPFVFLTGHYTLEYAGKDIGHEIVDVVDIENDVLVRRYAFPDNTDDAIAAYDFDKGKVWIIGYENGVKGMSPYKIDEYNVDLKSMNPEKTFFITNDIVFSYSIGGPTKGHFQENLACGTLQDATFNDGYIYLSTSAGSSSEKTEWARIHAYDIYAHRIVDTQICPDSREVEGLTFDGENLYMTTVGNVLWQLSERSGYDRYNYEPATEMATDSFAISNANQLVWFISQVYNGRSYIKGTLTADIDMSQAYDPFTYYVYDTNIADGRSYTGRQFEAFYAFRGCFDGQGHTISNFMITQTPYYNEGLFPYVVDATIRNVKVKGSIRLTKAQHSSSEKFNIKNVGFIGYMNGGTLENIDVSGLVINVSAVSTYDNVHRLVGSENGTITKTGIKE